MTPRPSHPVGQSPKTLLRNLGAFFGHVAHGVRTPVDASQPKASIVREQVQEQEVQTPQGKVVLRRRIIDEVEPARESGS